MPLPYATAGLSHGATDAALVCALQRDLRMLGYLDQGIDGAFGAATAAAVRRLQYDLQHNDGGSTGGDGAAPVAVRDYNQGRVNAETGSVDPALAACIEALLNDPRWPKLPSATDAADANRRARASIAAMPTAVAPTPFLLAIFQQESSGRHFAEPAGDDQDSFVTLGLDCRPDAPNHITSRGYGIGQYTLFHHPPRPEEMQAVIADPLGNVQRAQALLRDKLEHFLRGGSPATIADDLQAEHPVSAAPSLCRYAADDPRHLRDCRACVAQTERHDLTPKTPLYAGATQTYGQAVHYKPTTYRDVPIRAEFPCDWPYAVRRYNGNGPDSYHYQARVLLHLASPQSEGT